jgi:hypothetical protein
MVKLCSGGTNGCSGCGQLVPFLRDSNKNAVNITVSGKERNCIKK